MGVPRAHFAGFVVIAVAFALGIGAGAAVASLPADTGSILSFAGSLIGSALTIVGAIYLFEHQRQQTRTASKEVMKDLVTEIMDQIEKVRSAAPIGGVEDAVPALLIITHADRLLELLSSIKFARQWFIPDTPGMVRAFAAMDGLNFDRDSLKADLRPNIFYGGVPDLEKHLGMLESRVRVVLSQLEL